MINNLKVLFVNPATINRDALPIPPLGILYLAAYIRENGFKNIEVVDNNFYQYPLSELELWIQKFDIIAVSGTTAQYHEAVKISEIAKRNQKVSIIGGPHATPLPKEILQNSNFDFVVIGEGELTFLELLREIQLENPDFQKVDGIVFHQNGKIVKTQKRSFISDLDKLPLPARDLIPLHEYGNRELKRFKGPYTHIMASRGCGGQCTFCSSPMMWRKWRKFSARKVFEEMVSMNIDFGITNIHFQDDNFTASKERVFELCRLIEESKLGFKWSCQTRPDRVDDELLFKMKKAGCVQVEFGVESGDERILKLSKKNYKKEDIKRAFTLAKKAGITTYGFFLIGLPGETIISWVRSMRFAKQLNPDSCVWTVLVPYPGTEIYSKKLVKILDYDYEFWLYKQPIIKTGNFGPFLLKVMRWIADKYINGLFNAGAYRKK